MDVRIPEVGESVREALLAKWFKKNGDIVKKDEPLCEIETDKITLDINADSSGILSVLVVEGVTVKIGTVIGSISVQATEQAYSTATANNEPATGVREESLKTIVSSPSIRREMREQDISPESVTGTGKGGRITLDDLFTRIEDPSRRKPANPVAGVVATANTLLSPATETTIPSSVESSAPRTPERLTETVKSESAPTYEAHREERRPMSPIRKRISERLVAARQQTAMLTTFNEVDMSRVTEIRAQLREQFKALHGVSLGLMPFFIKACVEALREFPMVNASIDGDVFVLHNFYDIGVAIGSEKGLVVPVLRNVDSMKWHEIDQGILDYKHKIATNQIAISDLTGGTFTVSNGGIYGSMLSTPIINLPQSAVLGMHSIQDRPVARDGLVVIRPMMYLALSYDHRIVDGREAVGFLKTIREYVENVDKHLIEG
jgi:2-oxoglutarate dehydrogenase E2 component (dihydrolipoamide succinyltransferase)